MGNIDWGLVFQGVNTAANIYASQQAGEAEREGIRDARNATTAGSSAAIEELRRQNLQARADLAPYNAGGQGAFAAYQRAMGITPAPIAAPVGAGAGAGTAAGARFPGASAVPSSARDAARAGAEYGTYGGAAGTAVGSAFFGPVGGAIGGALGRFVGERVGPEVERRGAFLGPLAAGLKWVPGPVSGLVNKFIGDGGDLATGSRVYANSAGNFFDQNGNIIARVKPPAEGMTEIPGLSRNGNPIFITSEGKIVKQQQSGGGFDDLGFNINDAKDGPVEVNKIIAKGYSPQPATDADFGFSNQGAIGLLPGEANSTGLIPLAGGAATPQDRYGGFVESPGYKFLFDETMRGARAQGSARGGLYSGRMLKELQERATGLASQDFGNYVTRLLEGSRIGANAAAQQASNASSAGGNTANILTDTAGTLGNLALGAGQSRASSIANTTGVIQSGLGALADYYARRDTGGTPAAPASTAAKDYIYYDPFKRGP